MQPLDADEPHVIGPYRLLGRLGAGGMGRVYLARTQGGRTVAVKVVHPHFALDEQFRERFRREVASARRVGARWTAPVLDADPEAPVPWVATGYVAGPSLAEAAAAHGPLPERSVRALGAGLAEALAAVHALGLVHRDVKPSNVLLALDGPRLIDFGIARATDSTASLTSTGVSVGSPGYMSPEQILGKAGGQGVDGATDVFSLGAVLAFAATGVPPFSGDSSAALLYKVVHEEPELAPGLAGTLRELVAACLAKDPAARPAPDELARALAPDGAAASMAGGWLPPPVVEDVSRAAVRLLDLEAGPHAAAPGPDAGPHAGPGAGADSGAGPAAGASAEPLPGTGPGSFTGTATPPPPTAADSAGAFGPPPVAHLPTADAVPPPPRTPPVSLSVTTSAEPAGPRGGRKVSCSVALAVAGALAAVTVGAAVLFDVLPGGDRPEDGPVAASQGPSASASAPGGGAGGTAPTGPSPSGSGSPAPVTSVPEAFVGTWKGPFKLTFAGTEISAGTFTVVITEGATGERVGTVNQFDAFGNFTCEDDITLTSATEDTLLVEGRASAKPLNRCTSGTHTVKLTLNGERLEYASDEPRAGNPSATLDRFR
ncbi:serine/threonine protein kinase [Streptomyces sp. CC53]|uniref:serine/threonine-protein kinase n=1 Tax=unclassified Streptomyces TaxID=2593676 RepID=UPI0008DDA91B|nr:MULTISPECIES: serine/threonine-protein kinase [unclassified Streptomyces]OII61832.1 serine/threonine protein kinase [Streptomyces sp. CC53]